MTRVVTNDTAIDWNVFALPGTVNMTNSRDFRHCRYRSNACGGAETLQPFDICLARNAMTAAELKIKKADQKNEREIKLTVVDLVRGKFGTGYVDDIDPLCARREKN